MGSVLALFRGGDEGVLASLEAAARCFRCMLLAVAGRAAAVAAEVELWFAARARLRVFRVVAPCEARGIEATEGNSPSIGKKGAPPNAACGTG